MRKICTITARSTSSWVRPVDCDSGREMLSLSLKTVLVHNSVKSLIMETNFQKGGQVHCVPCAKSREKLQEFQKCLCPFKQRDMSEMTRVPNFILQF